MQHCGVMTHLRLSPVHPVWHRYLGCKCKTYTTANHYSELATASLHACRDYTMVNNSHSKYMTSKMERTEATAVVVCPCTL